MTAGRALLVGLLVAIAAILQSTVMARLGLPAGAPQLLVVVVVAVALADGPPAGMVAGFAGGLLADLLPSSTHPLGQSALVLVLVGQLAGLLRRDVTGGVAGSLLLVAVATVAAATGTAALGGLLGQPHGAWSSVARSAIVAAGYDALIAPFVLALVGVVWRHAGRRQPAGMPR